MKKESRRASGERGHDKTRGKTAKATNGRKHISRRQADRGIEGTRNQQANRYHKQACTRKRRAQAIAEAHALEKRGQRNRTTVINANSKGKPAKRSSGRKGALTEPEDNNRNTAHRKGERREEASSGSELGEEKSWSRATEHGQTMGAKSRRRRRKKHKITESKENLDKERTGEGGSTKGRAVGLSRQDKANWCSVRAVPPQARMVVVADEQG